MSAAEVIQMLDATVDWYRTLGIQQQIADEPSDLLSLAENRQIANQVVGLAFDVARASADQLVEGPPDAAAGNQASASAQTLAARQQKLDSQAVSIQNEMESMRAKLGAAPRNSKAALQAKIAELRKMITVAPGVEAEFARLNRDYDVTRQEYQSLVDRLARHGLVQRCVCEFDRRGIYVEVTEAGRERYAQAEPTYRDVLRRTLPADMVR